MDDSIETVKAYLGALQARDFDQASTFLAPNAEIVFPFGRLADLDDYASRVATRYRWLKKQYGGFDRTEGSDEVVVYSHGTMYGERLDGSPFEGVRYIDRFELRAGKITSQRVWNDMASRGIA